MDKLAKCPFCGGEALLFRGIGCMLVKCANAGCPLHDVDMGVASWNTRPLESALRQRVEELQAILDDCALLAHRVKMQCYSCECYEEGDCHTDCVSDYARKIYDDLSALRKPKKTSSEIDPKVFAMTEEDKRKITDLMDWVERSGKSYYVFKSALKELKGE
jgi:hypothetical protein